MRDLTARFILGADSRLRDILRSRDRLQVVFGVLFTACLVIGTTFWDEAAFQSAPVTRTGWTGIAVSAGLCIFFLCLCRNRLPILLCAAFLLSVRLAFALAGSTPDGNVLFAADCLAVCLSLSAIAFRTEIMRLSQRVHELIRAKLSRTTPASESRLTVSR
jgi:hypothetical protein